MFSRSTFQIYSHGRRELPEVVLEEYLLDLLLQSKGVVIGGCFQEYALYLLPQCPIFYLETSIWIEGARAGAFLAGVARFLEWRMRE